MSSLVLGADRFGLELLTKWAPKTCAALAAQGHLSLPMAQSTWCGPVLSGSLSEGPLLAVDTLEQPVISLYPGTLCLRLSESRQPTYDPMVWAKPPREHRDSVELVLAYGFGEYRTINGPLYVTPVAMIRDFSPALAAKLQGAAGAAIRFDFAGAPQ